MKFSFMYFLLMTAQRKNSLLAFYSLNTGLPLGALGPLAALRSIVVFFVGASCIPSFAETKLFDMDEIHDVSTLAVEVIKDWHVVEGNPPTRQKCVTIRVGEAWEGQEYRVPLRMIVPVDRKAKGFHLTTDYEEPEVLKNDARISSLDAALIAGGVGLVQTTIGGEPRDFREGLSRRFIETLNPHYAVQYWGWPATIMRAVTAAYAENDHFEKGKVAASGGSKHGSSPTVSLISDERITALYPAVA